jgi:hypothetical protein
MKKYIGLSQGIYPPYPEAGEGWVCEGGKGICEEVSEDGGTVQGGRNIGRG